VTGWIWAAWIGALLAALPLVNGWLNLRVFRAPSEMPLPGTRVSILIPARDEERNIEAAVRAALASTGVGIEVVVLDDQSGDRTAAIVEQIATGDARVRLLGSAPLSAGWAGKQRACQRLAEAARFEVLMFIDADVRIAPNAAAAAAGHLLADPKLGLVSGFPREITVTLGERLVIPWIHVMLIGYLPMRRMRESSAPAYGAACGQWVIARRDAYRAVGGHGAAPQSRHDGISLPRTFRTNGWMTDLFDGSRLAECRMYDSFGAVWHGFGKSAGEGMATPRALPIWTVLIAGGHVLPWLCLLLGVATLDAAIAWPGALGVAANLGLRWMLCRRLGSSTTSAWLHPVGAVLTLGVNWSGLLRYLAGRPTSWRGRSYRRGEAP